MQENDMDTELVRLAQAGDQHAFNDLYARHLPYVRGVVSRILRNRQDEVADTAITTMGLAFTRIGQFRGDSGFRTWLCGIAMRQARSLLRSENIRPLHHAGGLEYKNDAGGEYTVDVAVARDDTGFGRVTSTFDLAKIWPQLQAREQVYLELRYIQGIQFCDIATQFGLSEGTIKSTVHRALKKARTLMEEQPKPAPHAKEVFCPYCGALAQWLPDSAVYAGSYGGMVYACLPCKAWVGCHRRTDGQPGSHPLGRLATAELRKLKVRVHGLFDPIWRSAMKKRDWDQKRARGAAYGWLAKELGIDRKHCHVSKFDEEMCRQAIQMMEGYYSRIAAKGEKAS